ncbi:hypothetical protein [Halorhabdus sp. BNX81]|uniref:hypothetical protein n=1 Tax=Halorhabdus sp. BNX81 TaxID=2980181 RepID=UPI0023DD25F1|nr:hypothetical protein [Halorhabdus sp. BNX81]WEL21903.1 hypothetical protein HBNXHr_1847 [Halorhabdus sp. BNX81]
MDSRGLVTFAILVLVVTAGCSGLGDETDAPTLTPAPVPDADVHEQVVTPSVPTESVATFTPENPSATGPLGLRDQRSVRTALWRLRTVLDVGAIEPTVVRQFGLSRPVDAGSLGTSDAVTGSLGPTVDTGGVPPGRVDSENATVRLLRGMYEPSRLEYHLAYLHTRFLQDRLGWADALARHDNGTLDRRLVATALDRGASAYAADAYAAQYSLSVDTPVREWQFGWLDSPWLARAAVRAGYDYAGGQITAPDSLGQLYTEPPNTTEQLLHGLPPGSEPPQPLEVTLVGTGDWNRVATEQFGELGIRALLSTRIDGDEADRAARGWGNDRLLAFEDGTTSGVVWVTTWDQPSYAEQFLAGYQQYAAAGNPPQTSALTRPGSKAVVVTAGSSAFVEGVTVAGDNESVSVSLSE